MTVLPRSLAFGACLLAVAGALVGVMGVARADEVDAAADAGAASTADQLARMGHAVREQSYLGTLVYVQGDAVESMELVHRAVGGEVRERLTSVSGARREVICEGDTIKFFLGDERAVMVEKRGDRAALPRLLPADAAVLGAQYKLSDQGRRTEAGRSCRILSITPKDSMRYGYRLCLDEQNGLPLRTEVLAEDGKRVIEQVVFTKVEFPARISDADLRPRSDARGWTWQTREDEAPATPEVLAPIEVNALPPGFAATQTAAHQGEASQHLAFSDGVASISVFVEPFDPANQGLAGAARMGATNLYGRVVGPHQITVVGEVPAATVRAIAEAVTPRIERPVDLVTEH